MAINEEIQNKIKELLRVIDIEVCDLNNDSITINDSLYPDRYNEVIQLPVRDYKTDDGLRVFESSKMDDENYFFRVLNTKYPKIPFKKNGVEFNITISKTKDEKNDEENFNLELFYNGCYYVIFIGRNHDEKYICCRIKDKEWMDFSYIVNPKNKKIKREISVAFNSLSHQAKKLTAIDDKDNSSVVVQKFLKPDFSNDERYEMVDNDVNKYFNAIAFRLKNIMSSIIEVIGITNEKFLNIIYSDYPIIKEFIDMTDSKVTEELIDNFFEKYSNINIGTKEEQKLIKKKVQTKDIMINLIKYNRNDRLTTSEYLDLIKIIYKELKEKQLLDKYDIAFDVDIESLKRVAEYNSDIFIDEIRYSDEIRIRVPEMLDDYFEKYFIDQTIDGIVKNYCETTKKKEEQGPVLKKVRKSDK